MSLKDLLTSAFVVPQKGNVIPYPRVVVPNESFNLGNDYFRNRTNYYPPNHYLLPSQLEVDLAFSPIEMLNLPWTQESQYQWLTSPNRTMQNAPIWIAPEAQTLDNLCTDN